MQQKLLRVLESEACFLFKKYERDILDIILFGSFRKGKNKPQDIDVLILFKEKKNQDISYSLRKGLEKKVDLPIQIITRTYAELFQETFPAREGILANGYSLIHKKSLAECFGFESRVLFQYELKGKNKSERMQFYYALYGRKKEGVLALFGAKKYSNTLILCPSETAKGLADFFEYWKMEWKEMPVLIPKRLL